MCYFQKWDVSTTEIAHPLWQVSIWIWTSACSFKQNVQGMPARNGEVFVVVVQWHLLWKSVGETPAWCKTACDWTRFSFCSRPIGSLLFFPSVFIPPFSACHLCFSCPSLWVWQSPLDGSDHRLWADTVYSHLPLPHICSVKCSLWCDYEPRRLNQA